MIAIICGHNYVGKTTTIAEIKSAKNDWMYAYHPRFNDSQNYHFKYNVRKSINNQNGVQSIIMHVPRDIVYQISHMTCLNYLKTMHENHNILLDRCFISEMVYNEIHDRQIYLSFVDILKSLKHYKIFYLTVDSDLELRKRITDRLIADKQKTFGVRIENAPVVENIEIENDAVSERFNLQRELDKRYRMELTTNNLEHVIIDTSSILQKEVADIIIKELQNEK